MEAAPAMMHVSNGVKRRWIEMNVSDSSQSRALFKAGIDFLTLHKESGLFHTERWVNKDTSLFIPLIEDTSIRVRSFDQITYPCTSSEVFFIGDTEERYAGSISGQVIHFWKYSEQKGRLFIARSILCTDVDVYEELSRLLAEF